MLQVEHQRVLDRNLAQTIDDLTHDKQTLLEKLEKAVEDI